MVRIELLSFAKEYPYLQNYVSSLISLIKKKTFIKSIYLITCFITLIFGS